MTDGKIG